MSSPSDDVAWLQTSTMRYVLNGNCSIGRDESNSLVLAGSKVSRRHAIIHLQNMGEFWLIDLGSINGTFVNHRRIHQPVRLRHGDRIAIGDIEVGFHEPGDIPAYQTAGGQQTERQVEDVGCWLLLADIKEFTQLCRSVVTERLAHLLGGWLASCKEVVEANGGTINKYLGDGFLAYWRDTDDADENVLSVIRAFKTLQTASEPTFRFVVHTGSIAIGGVESMGEESLMGREINLLFRLEKLAGSLGESSVLSNAAAGRLSNRIECRHMGEYALKGFEGKHSFYSV